MKYKTLIDLHGATIREYLSKFPNVSYNELGLVIARHPLLKPDGGNYGEKTISGALSVIKPFSDRLEEIKAEILQNKDKALEAFVTPTELLSAEPHFDLPTSDMPFPDGEWLTRKPYEIKGKRALVMNDIHLSHHVNGVLKLAIDSAKDFKIDTIIINGDLLELDRISRWQSKPDAISLKNEIELGRKFLAWIRSLFPEVEIIFHAGNHDIRVENYILQKAPDLFGMGFHELSTLLEFDIHKVTYVDQYAHMKFGELNIAHGHHLKGGGVNLTQTKFKNANCNLLFGHHHIVQEYTTRDLNGKIKGAWSVGCMCTLSPEFSPINNWNWGFALLERDDRLFKVHNKKVIQEGGEFIIL